MASNGELRGTAILDIRRDQIGVSILDDMRQQLRPIDGKEKRMPTMLLYDEKGLKLFEEITYLDEYYLTNAEISVLEKYADNIVERVQAGSQVIELGSGYALRLPGRTAASTLKQAPELTDVLRLLKS